MITPEFQPGELDQKVDVYREITVPDVYGGDSVTRSPVVTGLWVGVVEGQPDEVFIHDGVATQETVTFIMRFRSDLEAGDIIVYKGEDFNIRGIPSRTGRHQYMVVQAERGVGV